MIRGYMAMSADGYIADAGGGVGWLEPFEDVDYGYDAFLGEIETVVMGRRTYEQIEGFGLGWPYGHREGIVLSSGGLEPAFAQVSV